MGAVIVEQTTVVAAPGQVSADLEGEAVILSVEKGMYYGLDPVGARIWTLIQEPRLVGDLRDAIIAEYDVDPGQCLRDIVTLLGDMAEQGLVEVRDASVSQAPAHAAS